LVPLPLLPFWLEPWPVQVLDDGRLTDGQGRTVNFKNCIVIMTSNVGSPTLLEGIDASGHIREDARDSVMEELRRSFRPEFLNRVDDVVLFKPLTAAETGRIVDLQMADLIHRLAGQRLELQVGEAARDLLAREGYSPVYGARPLKRLIQQKLETPIARLIIGGEAREGGTIKVDARKGELTIKAG
jgi:ATP-dependent Clp protease ATP-binding subunit ClpB